MQLRALVVRNDSCARLIILHDRIRTKTHGKGSAETVRIMLIHWVMCWLRFAAHGDAAAAGRVTVYAIAALKSTDRAAYTR
jgi:hypothetical protein